MNKNTRRRRGQLTIGTTYIKKKMNSSRTNTRKGRKWLAIGTTQEEKKGDR